MLRASAAQHVLRLLHPLEQRVLCRKGARGAVAARIAFLLWCCEQFSWYQGVEIGIAGSIDGVPRRQIQHTLATSDDDES